MAKALTTTEEAALRAFTGDPEAPYWNLKTIARYVTKLLNNVSTEETAR